MSLALLFHYLMLKMFRMLIHPSSGACDLFFELFHGLYCSGSVRVGVTVWSGWGGVVSGWRLQPAWNQSNTTHEITQQISRKLLRMDVLTSETCWALNNEIIKQVTSSWSLFIQLVMTMFSNSVSRIYPPSNSYNNKSQMFTYCIYNNYNSNSRWTLKHHVSIDWAILKSFSTVMRFG